MHRGRETHERAEPSPSIAARCTLSLDELAARRKELIPGLFDRARTVTDVDALADDHDGLRFEFASAPGLLGELAAVIERERGCCSFLRFALAAEPHAGAIVLEVTGPAGTGAMLRGL